MKRLTLLVIILFTGFKLSGQNVYSIDKFKISFKTIETLEESSTEFENVVSFENDNVAVDIEIVPIKQESKKFIKNLKKGAKEIARDFGLKGINDGGQLQKIDHGYFVKAFDFENGKKYPVFIVAALNYDMGIAYEISVDGYNLNEAECIRIINSFKIIK